MRVAQEPDIGRCGFLEDRVLSTLTEAAEGGDALEGIEMLARAIHEDYVRKQDEKGHAPVDNPSMVPWDELPEQLRESNRRQAEHIATKLRAIGCGIVPLTDAHGNSFTFDSREVERLARMEHERWWRERDAAGWTSAPA